MQNQNKTEVFTIGDLRLKHPPKIDAVPSVLKQDPNLPRNCPEFKQLAFLLINNSKITHMYNNTDKLQQQEMQTPLSAEQSGEGKGIAEILKACYLFLYFMVCNL